ncbi:MAG TPA: hypothetical protein DE179_07555 [Oceanospirillaceae bacterium]|nr:hypothetical protein [Oceanospirillaceae bacterium]
MAGPAVYLRYLFWWLWVAGGLVVFITLFVWRVTPWYSVHQTLPQVPYDVLVAASPTNQVVATTNEGLSARQLQRRLLAHFAEQSEALESEYDSDWLLLSGHLTAAQLVSLGTLPIWPGWQLQQVDLVPKAQHWSLQMRWQMVSQEASRAQQVLVGPQPEANFDARMWRTSGTNSGQLVGRVNDQIGAKADVPLVDFSSWRYVGFVRDAQGIGAWLSHHQEGHSRPLYCFVRVGDKCHGIPVLKIDEQALIVHGRKLQRAQAWRLPMATSGRMANAGAN